MNNAFRAVTQIYGLPVVHPENANLPADMGKRAPEAGYLLTTLFPPLGLEQANRILTETKSPGGGLIDNGLAFGAIRGGWLGGAGCYRSMSLSR